MQSPIYEPHIFSNPALPFIFHRDTIDANKHSSLNWHVNIEILYCREGEGTVICEGRVCSITAGDIFVINSNIMHSMYTDTGLVYDCLIIDHHFCAENGVPTDRLLFKELLRSDTLATAYEEVVQAYLNTDITRITTIRYAVLGFLLQLYRGFIDRSPPSSVSPDISERIKETICYIRKNLDKDLSLEGIAMQVGISKFYLSREFKRQTGQTLIHHINITRCKEAKRLIEGGMSISAAALSCGFENLSYFSRTYKRLIGILPSKERSI